MAHGSTLVSRLKLLKGHFLLLLGPSEVPTRRLSESTENSDMMNSSIKVATPEEFVKRFGGTRVINKVLIANNGIAGKIKILNHDVPLLNVKFIKCLWDFYIFNSFFNLFLPLKLNSEGIF